MSLFGTYLFSTIIWCLVLRTNQNFILSNKMFNEINYKNNVFKFLFIQSFSLTSFDYSCLIFSMTHILKFSETALFSSNSNFAINNFLVLSIRLQKFDLPEWCDSKVLEGPCYHIINFNSHQLYMSISNSNVSYFSIYL